MEPGSPERAVPYLTRLVAGFPPQRPRFDPRPGHVGFMVGNVALGPVTVAARFKA
jgi:hypothetical protein